MRSRSKVASSRSSNQALLVTVTLDGLEAQACYKAEAGERPLWDFPDGLWRREVAAYELDVALGTDLVPDDGRARGRPLRRRARCSGGWTTTKRTTTSRCANIPSSTTGSPNSRPLTSWPTTPIASPVTSSTTGRGCWAIDNGLCFHEQDKLRTVIWEYAGLDVERTPARAPRVASRTARPGTSATWLNPIELALAQHRAHGLVENATYPVPDEDSDWPPYPWPLI